LEEEKVKSNKTEVKKEEKSCHKFAVKKKTKTYKRSEKKIRLESFLLQKAPKTTQLFF
tara:strand:+ start:301 stop:474 length:174 start_codon:yes stop_codon:yes gene_type:complete